MPHSYGYGRESTAKQQLSGLGRDAQIEKIDKHASTLDMPYGGLFFDSAVSGMVRMTDRKAGAELDRCVRKGDVIIISRLDRAFRRTADAMVMVERWGELGIQLHVCDFAGQTMNLMSGIGKFILTVLVAFAELERSYISERTRIAMEQSRKKYGAACVRDAGYGYKWAKPGGKRIRVVDERQRDLMKTFYDWNTEYDFSYEHIAQHMNYTLKIKNDWGREKTKGQWSARTVQNWVLAEMRRRISETEDDPEAQAELLIETEKYADVHIIGASNQDRPFAEQPGLSEDVQRFLV